MSVLLGLLLLLACGGCALLWRAQSLHDACAGSYA